MRIQDEASFHAREGDLTGKNSARMLRYFKQASQPLGKTGVTADRDKIEFGLLNSILSRSAVTPDFPPLASGLA